MATNHAVDPTLQSKLTEPASHHRDVHLPQTSTDADLATLLDDSSDDDDDDAASVTSNADANSIVGISIGQDQNLMKCPTTPATTKAQALETTRTYFPVDEDDENLTFEESPPTDWEPSLGLPAIHADSPDVPIREPFQYRTSSPTGKGRMHEKRTSLVGSILGTASIRSRQRSSSASSWKGSIRRMLPSMPSSSHSGLSSTDKLGQPDGTVRVLGPAGPGIAREHRSSSISKATSSNTNRSNSTDRHSVSIHGTSDLNRAQIISHTEPNRPSPLRRVTSDQSLYIRRAPTGASQFDDYNNFADTSEMVNSRFKAITDSFQDSSLRLPKMLSISLGRNDEITDEKKSDSTVSNTMANTGTARAEILNSTRSTESKSSAAMNSSRHPMIRGALSRISGDLVILGGYRGSVLREAQAPHRQLWVPVRVGLNLRKADLEVGLTREDELRMSDTIIAGGTLSHIGPVDICRRLIKKCRKCPNVKEGRLRVHDYGYDWRLSPELLVDRYITYLESLPCNQKNRPVRERGAWVIAHSLGGLITRNAINHRPELFAGVVYAGTPQNCVNILGPLRNGDDVLFSSRVLTAQVNFTLRTSYALLPEDGRCFINKQSGERYDLDLFDVKTWEEYRLSPCIKAALHRPKQVKRHHILGSASDLSTTSSSHIGDGIVETAEAAAAQASKPDNPLDPSLSDAQHSRPSIATTSTIPLPLATEYLRHTLTQTLKFKQSLCHNRNLEARNAYPPAAILFAKNTPTVYGAFVGSREDIKYDDCFDELAFAAGDGVVLASAAQLPLGYRCVRGGRVESDRGHVGLLGDLEGIGRCLSAVIGARDKGVGSGAYQEAQKETRH